MRQSFPFIGLQPLSAEQRDRTQLLRAGPLAELKSLLATNQEVLLLARSGIGKTSLLYGPGGLRDSYLTGQC